MAEAKTRPTRTKVSDFLQAIPDESCRKQARQLLALMKKETRVRPVMWGPGIIGFGTYRYRYVSGREGDWPRVGFSPRKAAISIYLASGFKGSVSLLKRLGKHKTGVGCLYIKRLEDVHLPTLRKLVKTAYREAGRLSA
jgi:hypothetical protein